MVTFRPSCRGHPVVQRSNDIANRVNPKHDWATWYTSKARLELEEANLKYSKQHRPAREVVG
ncbi:hypothetical protein R6Q59_021197 [Mikania micrantha]